MKISGPSFFHENSNNRALTANKSRLTLNRQVIPKLSDQLDIRNLIECAHSGDRDSLGRLLELYRQYLKTIARRRMGSMLNRRMDVSDVVQQTMVSAHQYFGNFVGSEDEQLQAWLRQILVCNISTAIRDHLYTKKRGLSLETSIDSCSMTSDPNGKEMVPVATSPSPSMKASQLEESLRLLDHLDGLPQDQATAVRLRYLECCSIREIAEHLDRSVTAAAGLVKRGVQNLRRAMNNK